MTDAYHVELSRRAAMYLRRLDRPAQRRVRDMLRQIASGPEDLQFSTQLHGNMAGFRRARVGNLRIIFSTDHESRRINVSDIGPRGDIYHS